MSNVLVNESSLSGIAQAIRRKNGTNTTYKPGQMAAAIAAIPVGYPEPTGTVTITQNGTANVKDYASANVNVPNTYAAEDEGKVVQNAALVAQTARAEAITQNGIYDTTTNDEVTVNVPSGGILTGTTPPTSNIGNDGDYYMQTFPLASGVSFVGYLESSGTQYIDTGIIGDQNIKIVADYMLFSHSQFIFGARYSRTSRSITIFIPQDDTSSIVYMFGKNVDSTSSPKHSTSYNTQHKIELGHGVLKYDDDLVEVAPTAVFRTPSPIALFGCNTSNGSVSATTVRIYRLTIYSSDNLIADYIPCLDGNGVACMWDNVAGEYVYNDGTGNFAYGSTATPDALDAVLYVKRCGAWEVVRQ